MRRYSGTMNRQKDDAWADAKRRCRLNDEDVRMAKELGFKPKSLIKNIPSPSQQWKAPVKVWVRDLYEKKIGSRKRAAAQAASKGVVPALAEVPAGLAGEERRK